MGFRDFNDEGPGTFGWDYVLGQNTTGLFPDETHYILDGDVLEEVEFTYAGGESWRSSIVNCWSITDIAHAADGSITFRQGGHRFRAVPYYKMRMKDGQTVYNIVEL